MRRIKRTRVTTQAKRVDARAQRIPDWRWRPVRDNAGQVFFIEMALAIVGVIVIAFTAARVMQWINAGIGGRDASYQGSRASVVTAPDTGVGGGGDLHLLGPGPDAIGMGGGNPWYDPVSTACGAEAGLLGSAAGHRQDAKQCIEDGRTDLFAGGDQDAYTLADWARIYMTQANWLYNIESASVRALEAQRNNCWMDICVDDGTGNTCNNGCDCDGSWCDDQCGAWIPDLCGCDPILGCTGGFRCNKRTTQQVRDCVCWDNLQATINGRCAAQDGWLGPDGVSWDVEGPQYGPWCSQEFDGIKECSTRLQEAAPPIYQAGVPYETQAYVLLQGDIYTNALCAFAESVLAETDEATMIGACIPPAAP